MDQDRSNSLKDDLSSQNAPDGSTVDQIRRQNVEQHYGPLFLENVGLQTKIMYYSCSRSSSTRPV